MLRKNIRIAVLATGMLFASAACASPTSGSPQGSQSVAPQPLHVVAGVADPTLLPLWIAFEDGSFSKAGLNVTIDTVGGNVGTEIVSDQADLGVIGVGSALAPVQNGADTSVVYYNALTESFVFGATGVNSVSQCTKAATSVAGTTSAAAAVLYKKLFHADFTILNLGTTPRPVPLPPWACLL